jgi:hypothetical protein
MIHAMEKAEFLERLASRPQEFLESIRGFDAYVVKRFYPPERMVEFREFLWGFSQSQPPSWHPCLEGCPDYHRINDEYPHSYVRSRMHGFYFHRWNANRRIFEQFKDLFTIKNRLAGKTKDAYWDTLPSDGVISRITIHQYPKGGGYQVEHMDPTSPFALIQTILQASCPGEDFQTGGLYFRKHEGGEIHRMDLLTQTGDLIVLSPQIRHGVAPIDPGEKLDWSRPDGRWIILPVIIRSDYTTDPRAKPREAHPHVA